MEDAAKREVLARLTAAGLVVPQDAGGCAVAAIARGHLRFVDTRDLDAPAALRDGRVLGAALRVTDRSGQGCTHAITPSLRDLLTQPDYPATDYEDGLVEATVRCRAPACATACEGSARAYVTSLCTGAPAVDDGKHHHHCNLCPALGVCLGDGRRTHCTLCGKHFWQGGFDACPCRGPQPSEQEQIAAAISGREPRVG